MPKIADHLQRVMRSLDQHFKELTGKRIGITMFVFELNQEDVDGTHVDYISNADRDGMIKAVKEWLVRVESGMTNDPPGPLARG